MSGSGGQLSSCSLFDMHCHLDFMDDREAVSVADDAAAVGLGLYSVTVEPAGLARASTLLGSCSNVCVGLGLHPWWVADGRCGQTDIRDFETAAQDTRFIGEVGLDFGARAQRLAKATGMDGQRMRQVQTEAFERVLKACSGGGKLLSIHAVAAASDVLDALDKAGTLPGNDVIFHWFSGSSDELQRAVQTGCFFSVNARMLASRRGREYARVIPQDRLLIETDEPSEQGGRIDAQTLRTHLEETLDDLQAIRGKDVSELIAQTSCRLLERSWRGAVRGSEERIRA